MGERQVEMERKGRKCYEGRKEGKEKETSRNGTKETEIL